VVSVVSPLVWVITVVVLLAIMLLDLTVIARRQRTVTTKDAVSWVLVYIGIAAAFAVGLFVFLPGYAGQEFVAGYITEYSLSVDNLFVFMIIMARFSVPPLAQDKVLYIGIVLSLVSRAVFILAGAAAIAAASWVFYISAGSWSTPRSSWPSRTPTRSRISTTTSRCGLSAASCRSARTTTAAGWSPAPARPACSRRW
jgi:tellurite resistance protein TerC